jgi:hypothetical protein
MSQISQSNYDLPVSHTSSQSRFVINANKKVYTPSLRLLNVEVTANKNSYFPTLVGCYSLIKRIQLKLAGRLVSVWQAEAALPLLVAMMGDNETQKGILSQLSLTGNNTEFDNETELLRFQRPEFNEFQGQIKLNVFLDLLNKLQIANDTMEIIIDWNTNAKKTLCPVDPADPATSYSITKPPFLSYETLNGNWTQPDNVLYNDWVQDVFSIPTFTGSSGSTQKYEIRSNAFNNKTIGRLLIVNTPASVNNLSPDEDVKDLFDVFGTYMSVPMKQEIFNISLDGQTVLTYRNVNNDSTKLSITSDCWGPSTFVTNGHIHSKRSVLAELQEAPLNGFASFGACNLNQFVGRELVLSYSRVMDNGVTYPTLKSQLFISCVAEVKCMLKGGEKVYM